MSITREGKHGTAYDIIIEQSDVDRGYVLLEVEGQPDVRLEIVAVSGDIIHTPMPTRTNVPLIKK